MSSVPVALPRTLGRRLGSLPIAVGAAIGFIVAYGLAHTWKLTFGYLFERLANIGIPTGIAGTIHPFRFLTAVDATVQNALYSVQRYGERGMVWGFTNFVELPLLLAGTALALGMAVFELGEWSYTLVTRQAPRIIRETVVKPVEKVVTITKARADARIGQLEHTVARLAAQVRATAIALPHDIALAPTKVGITAKQLRRLARRTHELEKKTVGLGAVALVTAALVHLGFRFVKCAAWQRAARRVTCGMGALLGDLLAETLDVLLIRDLCSVVKTIERIAIAFEDDLLKLVDEIEGFICGGEAVVPSGIVRADLKRVAKRPTGITAYDLQPPVPRKIAA